nr:unnamed protein product [Callosobruchus analis]
MELTTSAPSLLKAYIGFIFFRVPNKLPVDITEDLTMIVGGLTTLHLSVVNSVSYKLYQRLAVLLTDFRRYGKPANFDKVAERSNFLSSVYTFYCFFGCVAYGIASRKESHQCFEVQLTVERNLFCGAFTVAWFPININLHLIFFMQILLCVVVLAPCALCCFIFVEMVEFVLTHIDHLEDHVENVFQKSGNERRNMIKFCVEYHQHTLSSITSTT